MLALFQNIISCTRAPLANCQNDDENHTHRAKDAKCHLWFDRSVFKPVFKIKMATSNTFEADLPELSPEQLSKLYTWGQTSCDTFDLRMNSDMTMVLSAKRKKTDTARGHMRLLRTNLVNWGVSLPTKQVGWLRLTTEESRAPSVEDRAAEATHPSPCHSQDSTPGEFELTVPVCLLTAPIVA